MIRAVCSYLGAVKAAWTEAYEPAHTEATSAAGVEHPVPAAEGTTELTWEGWAVPAICDVLATHHPEPTRSGFDCNPGTEDCPIWPDEQDWRNHVAPLIAARIACDPVRAAQALKPAVQQMETGLDMGASIASEFFPQHRKTQK